MNGIVTTNSTDEICDLVRQCIADGLAIVDYGAFHDGLGHPPPSEHVRIVPCGGVIEHYADDMAVRVSAGATLGEVNDALAETNQFLPIDADRSMIIGEIINHNVYGPLRTTYGAARDLLLGLRVVDGRGEDIQIGGRVVKNVAGYDLARFLVGGLGEFGIISEATFRTYAVPSHAALVRMPASVHQASAVLTPALPLSDISPNWLSQTSIDGESTLVFGYLGTREKCQWQCDALVKHLIEHNLPQPNIEHGDPAFDERARISQRDWHGTTDSLVKIIVPPASTSNAIDQLVGSAGNALSLSLDALPTHGCVFVGCRDDQIPASELADTVTNIVTTEEGLCIWFRVGQSAPDIRRFQPEQTDRAILLQLKQVMDPHGILNPGRYLSVAKTEH